MPKKCYTIETRLNSDQLTPILTYLEDNLKKQGRIFRITWRLIQTSSMRTSKLNTYLQTTCNIDKRTANTHIKTATGRLHALKELKVVEAADLRTKIETKQQKIEKLCLQVQELKVKACNNTITKKDLGVYRKLKERLFHQTQKLNRMRQRLRRYEALDKRSVFPICFGGKRLFKAQYYLSDNDFRSHEGWKNAFIRKRDNQVGFIGSKDEPCGNQNFQLTYDGETESFTAKIRKDRGLMEDPEDKYIYIQNIDFKLHRDKLIEITALQADRNKADAWTPLTFRILRRGRKWYLQLVFTWVTDTQEKRTDGGVFGFDFNDGFICAAETDGAGNLISQKKYRLNHHGTGNKAKSEISEVISGIVALAKSKEKPIVIEDLDFKKKKSKTMKKVNKDYNKMIHAFDYSRYKKLMDNACHRTEVPLILVNPAYTSRIGKAKFADQMKLSIHQAAAFCIARKGQGYTDRVRSIVNGHKVS